MSELLLMQSGGGASASGAQTPYTLNPTYAFDAGQGVYVDDPGTVAAGDSDAVLRWKNQGSEIYDFLQLTSGRRPTLDADGLNGKPALNFDGADDHMTIIYGESNTAPETIYLALKIRDWQNAGFLYDGVDTTNRRYFFYSGYFYKLHAGSTLTSSSITSDSVQILTMVLDGANSKIFINGVQDASGNAGNGARGGIRLGCRQDLVNFFDGLIGHMFVYEAAHAAAEQVVVEDYLAAHYGIAISR